MHTIIEPYCTGCELCVPVCPVDCISFESVTGERTGWQAWSQQEADTALERYTFHSASSKPHKPDGLESHINQPFPDRIEGSDKKRGVIEAAMARARAAREDKK